MLPDNKFLEHLKLVKTVLNAVIEGTKEVSSHEPDPRLMRSLHQNVGMPAFKLMQSDAYFQTETEPPWTIAFKCKQGRSQSPADLGTLLKLERFVDAAIAAEREGSEEAGAIEMHALTTLADGRQSFEVQGRLSENATWYLLMRAFVGQRKPVPNE